MEKRGRRLYTKKKFVYISINLNGVKKECKQRKVCIYFLYPHSTGNKRKTNMHKEEKYVIFYSHIYIGYMYNI